MEVLVTQSRSTLCDPMTVAHRAPVHRILEASIVESVAIPFFSGSSQPRETWVSHFAGRFFTIWATREAPVQDLLELT